MSNITVRVSKNEPAHIDLISGDEVNIPLNPLGIDVDGLTDIFFPFFFF